MTKQRNYGTRKCERKGCGKFYTALTGNQKYCDAHKQSENREEKRMNEPFILMQLAASPLVNDDQRRALVFLIAKHYS